MQVDVAHWQSQEREGERVSVAICILTDQMFLLNLKMLSCTSAACSKPEEVGRTSWANQQ